MLRVRHDLLQIADRAIDKHAAIGHSWRRRYERIRAGGEHDVVVMNAASLFRIDNLFLAVDFAGTVADMQLDAVVAIPVEPGESELLGDTMSVGRSTHDAVVRGPRLFAKGDDAIAVGRIEFDQLFAKAMSDHAVADHDDGLRCERIVGRDHKAIPVRRQSLRHERDKLGRRSPCKTAAANADRSGPESTGSPRHSAWE